MTLRPLDARAETRECHDRRKLCDESLKGGTCGTDHALSWSNSVRYLSPGDAIDRWRPATRRPSGHPPFDQSAASVRSRRSPTVLCASNLRLARLCAVFGRLEAFLPAMAAANDALAQEDPRSRDIEELTDPEGEHIEMVRRPSLFISPVSPCPASPHSDTTTRARRRTWRAACWRARPQRRLTSRSSRSTRPASSASWRTPRQTSRPPSTSCRCPRVRRRLWRKRRRPGSRVKAPPLAAPEPGSCDSA